MDNKATTIIIILSAWGVISTIIAILYERLSDELKSVMQKEINRSRFLSNWIEQKYRERGSITKREYQELLEELGKFN